MTLPSPACVTIPSPPAPLSIRMPGGLTIQGTPMLQGGIITPMASIQSLLSSMAPAMAGLQPVFLIIDAIVKTMAVFNAIPGIIGGNLVDFFKALKEFVEAVTALAQLQPALSLPFMLLDLITAITTALQALRDVLTEAQALSTQGNAIISQAQASGDSALEAVGNCVVAQASAYGEHVTAALGPLGQLIDMATQLAGMMPSPPSMPSVGDATGLDLDGLASFIDNLVTVFEAIQIPGA